MTLVPFEKPDLNEEILIAKDLVNQAVGTLGYLTLRRSHMIRVRKALGPKASPRHLGVLDDELESMNEEIDEGEEYIALWREILEALMQRSA